MRRVLVVVALLLLAAMFWFVFDDGPRPAGYGGDKTNLGANDDASHGKEPVKAPRKRTAEEVAEESVSEFLRQWPQVGQDRPQDPTLGAIRGVALRAPGQPVTEGVVETSTRGEVKARARLEKAGAFVVKNVPPGGGIALAVRATDHSPGGVDKLLVSPGETLDVGEIYVGTALDPTTTNRVEVHVVNSAGEPVVGARVTATSTLYGALIALGAMEKQPGGTVVRSTTDAKGTVVFEKLPPSSYDVFAESDGLAFEVEDRYLVQRATQAVLTLKMDAGQSIEGKVVDEKGEPLADAHIGVFHTTTFTMYPATSTGADGRFVLSGLAGGSYMLFAIKEELGEKDVPRVDAGAKDLTIVIPAGSELVVKVTDAATKAPVKEFAVRPFRLGPFAYLYSPHIDVKSEEGVWRQRMPPLSHGVEVTAKGYARKTIPQVKLPSTEPVQVELDAAAAVQGRVTGKGDRRPVIGAKVYVQRGGMPPSPEKGMQTVTDAKGEFVLDGMPHEPTALWISHVDYTETSFPVTPQPRSADGVPPPVQEFELSGGGRIEGHAYGPGRVPLAGKQVSLFVGFLPTRNAVVLPDGSYTLTNVPPGTYRVAVDGWRGAAKNGVVVTDGNVAVVDFGADAVGQRLAGKIVKDDQSPAAKMPIELSGGGSEQQATSDAQGSFAFENVAPGRYSVSDRWGRTKAIEVVVKAEEPPAEVVLRLLAAAIEGRVVDAVTGEPLAGAWIDCEMTADGQGVAPSTPNVRMTRQTGDDGTFKITSLEDGRWRVRAYRDPYGTDAADGVEIKAGETKTGVEIRLTPGAGTLTGVATSAAGVPIEGAAVQLKDEQGRRVFFMSFATTSGNGSYTQGQLKPGVYDATMEKDGFAPATQRVVIETGKPTRADFTLLQGGRIEVTGRLFGGGPAAGATVSLLDAKGRRVEKSLTFANLFSTDQPKTDGNGQITVRGVAAGPYTVRLVHDDGSEATGSVEVVEGASTTVEIVFPAK